MHRRRGSLPGFVWEPGSAEIGDFVYFGRGYTIVTARVKIAYDLAGLTGFVASQVAIVEPKKRAKSKWPIVPAPYTGPALWDIYVPPLQLAHIIPAESTVDYLGPCEACGTIRYEPDVDVDEPSFVIDRKTWNGLDFILPVEVNGMFITERVAEVIRTGEFTNVELVNRGRISA